MKSLKGTIPGFVASSNDKLVSLRVARKIRTKEIGGTVYYNKEDVKRFAEEGF